MARTDTTLTLHKQKKNGKVETRVEIKQKVRQERKRKKYLNRRKENQKKETMKNGQLNDIKRKQREGKTET